MRNLKRALSLALASVMLMGMMVVGSSAASYPDVDDQDHVEAIGPQRCRRHRRRQRGFPA